MMEIMEDGKFSLMFESDTLIDFLSDINILDISIVDDEICFSRGSGEGFNDVYLSSDKLKMFAKELIDMADQLDSDIKAREINRQALKREKEIDEFKNIKQTVVENQTKPGSYIIVDSPKKSKGILDFLNIFK